MLIIVSPAKKLNFDDASPVDHFTQPAYLEKSQQLINILKKKSSIEIASLMKLSDKLTQLNVARYQNFKTPFNSKNAKQAIYTFRGDTYVGFNADTLSIDDIDYAQDHMRILSGLYGMLAPLDLMQPYRLEMGTRLPSNEGKDLYQFWQKTLTHDLNKLLKKESTLINLASKEYFSAVDFKGIKGQIITPVFKEKKGDTYKIIGIMAKRARGMMSRYIVENRIEDVEKIKQFSEDNYRYNAKASTDNEFVFLKESPATLATYSYDL